MIFKALLTLALALYHHRKNAPRPPLREGPGVSVLIAAYNEEVGIGQTLQSVLSVPYSPLEVIVVDDGSSDRTAALVEEVAARDARVRLLRQPNGGKAAALNNALQHARYEVCLSIDADSIVTPDVIGHLARHFYDPQVGAVAGDVRIAGVKGLLGRFQRLEYVVGQHLDKRAQDTVNAVVVVAGATGAFRRDVLLEVGGYSRDTLTEDMDLTIEIARRGYAVRFDPHAVSYTEPPATLRDLWKQRLRWTYGTLQVLIKHRRAVFSRTAGNVGLIGLPYVLLFGLLCGPTTPVFDAAVLSLVLLSGDAREITIGLLTTIGLEFGLTLVAVLMGRAAARDLWLVIPQRLFLRAFVGTVIVAALWRLVRRHQVGWQKLERRGIIGCDALATPTTAADEVPLEPSPTPLEPVPTPLEPVAVPFAAEATDSASPAALASMPLPLTTGTTPPPPASPALATRALPIPARRR
nr:glycosyltransferase family 2 protein [Deinobacterium chartae]